MDQPIDPDDYHPVELPDWHEDERPVRPRPEPEPGDESLSISEE